MSKRTDADNYVIKNTEMISNSSGESGGIFYYEISTFWSGKFTIKVKDGFLGWSDEKL